MEAKLVVVPPHTVDDFGDVLKLRQAFAPTEAKYNRLRAELNALTACADPEAEFVVTGERFTLRISSCSIERRVDIAKARKKMGAAAFLEHCSMTIKALGNFFAAPDVEKLLVSSRSGSRSYTPVPVAAEAG